MRVWVGHLLIVVALVIGLAGTANAAATAQADLTPAQAARYHALTQQLRCLVCQNLAIADSDAPLAADLRQLVARQIKAGRSDDQIKQFLVERYGDWVLYDPPFQWSTLLLWLGPFIVLFAGMLLIWRVARSRSQPGVDAPALDRARLAAVLAENKRASDAEIPIDQERAS